MRESLVAWAGDCQVRGEIDLGEGRLSDQVNEGDLLTFFGATLEAIEDGRQVVCDELEVGPFRVTGNLHRHPASQPFAALTRHQRFVPVTGATIDLLDGSRSTFARDVVLVNRELVQKHEPLAQIPVWGDDPAPDAALAGGGAA